jgi:hypothetical protein
LAKQSNAEFQNRTSSGWRAEDRQGLKKGTSLRLRNSQHFAGKKLIRQRLQYTFRTSASDNT